MVGGEEVGGHRRSDVDRGLGDSEAFTRPLPVVRTGSSPSSSILVALFITGTNTNTFVGSSTLSFLGGSSRFEAGLSVDAGMRAIHVRQTATDSGLVKEIYFQSNAGSIAIAGGHRPLDPSDHISSLKSPSDQHSVCAR